MMAFKSMKGSECHFPQKSLAVSFPVMSIFSGPLLPLRVSLIPVFPSTSSKNLYQWKSIKNHQRTTSTTCTKISCDIYHHKAELYREDSTCPIFLKGGEFKRFKYDVLGSHVKHIMIIITKFQFQLLYLSRICILVHKMLILSIEKSFVAIHEFRICTNANVGQLLTHMQVNSKILQLQSLNPILYNSIWNVKLEQISKSYISTDVKCQLKIKT